MTLALALAALVALGTACADDAATTDDVPADPAFPAPPDGEGVQLALADAIPAATERTTCRYLVLPDREVDLIRFEHAYTPGAHHVLVYPTDLTAAEAEADDAAFDCATRGDLRQTGVLYGGSDPDGGLAYPDGIGMRLPAASVVLLETHYLNAGDAALDAVARVNLWFAPAPVATLAGTLFLYDWAILVPPHAEARAEMRCAIPEAITLLGAVPHMHARGVGFDATLEPAGGGEDVALYALGAGDPPSPVGYAPPIEVAAGSAIRFGCAYRNDGDAAVVEGPSAADDEMCIFVAAYYPALPRAVELCQGAGSAPVLDGDATCGEAVDCMLDAGVGNWAGGQACVADACAGSAEPLARFVECVDAHACWGDEACVGSACLEEWNGCTSAGCAP